MEPVARPSIEEVVGALDTLYRSESPSDKEKASSWLIQLHSSVSLVLAVLLMHTLSVLHVAVLLCTPCARYMPGK